MCVCVCVNNCVANLYQYHSVKLYINALVKSIKELTNRTNWQYLGNSSQTKRSEQKTKKENKIKNGDNEGYREQILKISTFLEFLYLLKDQ